MIKVQLVCLRLEHGRSRMVAADESTELWRHPLFVSILNPSDIVRLNNYCLKWGQSTQRPCLAVHKNIHQRLVQTCVICCVKCRR